jgi:hypothetical protein
VRTASNALNNLSTNSVEHCCWGRKDCAKSPKEDLVITPSGYFFLKVWYSFSNLFRFTLKLDNPGPGSIPCVFLCAFNHFHIFGSEFFGSTPHFSFRYPKKLTCFSILGRCFICLTSHMRNWIDVEIANLYT